MHTIRYIDRQTKKEETEKVYGKRLIEAFYGTTFLSHILEKTLLPLIGKFSLLSRLYGYLQKKPKSRAKIRPFINTFHVDVSEFQDDVDSFASFNDFFIRKLKPSCRPIANGHDVAILPADGRYLTFQNIKNSDGFLVKGKVFSLEDLLQNKALAHKYNQGSMVIARLCPTDYHRFHFPYNCTPETPRLINGHLFSVNPIALKRNIHILSENKRVITPLHTKTFGTIQFIEVGATAVGSIHQTFTPGEHYSKGDEKGFFSFGGSCIILLFEPFRIEFDQDLVEASSRRIETKALFGQSLGRALSL
jgi:phosphatidylserine decarboxylase